MAVLASVALFSACEEEEELGLASLTSDTSELSFDVPAGEQTISLVATRDWSVKSKPDWVAVDPDNGSASTKAQNVTITVQPNPDMDRTGNVIFTIGFAKHAVTVNQKGEAGSEEDALIYFNDFDKEASTASYGSSGSSWPYLEEFDGWKNETGNGIADVTYSYNTVTARSNSASNSNYSDYDGSGSNNLFFGLNSFFAINEIALSGQTTFALSFGTEMYRGSSYDNTFDHNIFHVLVSSDGEKWVELDYSFANGDPNGRWDLATSKFSIKEAVSKLYIYFKADMGSIFRLDDVKLMPGTESDVIVDFAEGKDIDGGSDNPDEPDEPTEIKTVTIAEFLAAEESSTQKYQLTGTVSGLTSTVYGNFDLVDETGKVYVYGLTATDLGYGVSNDKSFASLGIEEGDVITIIGYRGSYQGKDEVFYAYFVSKEDGGDEPGSGDDPGDYTGGDYTITWASNSSWESPQDGVITYTSGVFMVTAEKKDGTTKPTVNASYNDLRAYAKNTVTISSNAIINKIVFNLSSAGLKRLAEITASEGTVADQASGDTVVTWTGSASSVTFTVGDSAVYGTDGASKAGQLDVSSIDVNAMF